MTRFDRAAAAFQARLQQVTLADLDAPTPCEGWSVRDLLAHLADEACWAAGVLSGEAPDTVAGRCSGELLDDEPIAAVHRLADAARSSARRSAQETVSFGETSMPTTDYLTELFADHLIHTWDLATATDGDTELDATLVDVCAAWFDAHERQWREAGQIGPPAPVPEGADPQTRLLARFGRTSRHA